ncbi:hypothetical protein H6504_01855 [Candidatus Woesearchaeota archaeon]|nr:hypothetical protein [Candidatus Woesearchaeota archaeon]
MKWFILIAILLVGCSEELIIEEDLPQQKSQIEVPVVAQNADDTLADEIIIEDEYIEIGEMI